MNGNRQEGGLWCNEVLARLSAYLDGELPAGERAQVDAHLAACPNCARFGGDVAGLLERLPAQPELSGEAARRLHEAVRNSWPG
ncbi:MAG: zf-HC2 domain-containing protein [Bryobacterales bacterium]|nr:zf-HC2 domain-containing protein [Bryobacterales bacterium]